MSTGDGQGIAHWSIDVWDMRGGLGPKLWGPDSGPQDGGGEIEGRDKKSWINSRIESIVHEEDLVDLEMQGQTNYTTNKIAKRDNTDQL